MEQLAIIICGSNCLKILGTIAELISKYECHILRAQLTPFGSVYSFSLLVTGNWNTIAKVESALQNIAPNLEGSLMFERTKPKTYQNNYLPYTVQVVGIDDTNLACEIWLFFSTQGMEIEHLTIETIISATNTSLFKLKISINVPADISLASLREQFAALCDELNVDGTIQAPNSETLL